MASLLIKNLPSDLHERLRRRARKNRRSMNGEVIAILEKEMAMWAPEDLPPPVKGSQPADGEWIANVIRGARDGRR